MRTLSKEKMMWAMFTLGLSTTSFSAVNVTTSRPGIIKLAMTRCALPQDYSAYGFDLIDFSMRLDNVAVSLAGYSPLADRASCAIRLPVTIPAGYFIARITQTIDLTVEKSIDSNANFAMRAAFHNFPAPTVTRTFPDGTPASEPSQILTHAEDFSADQSWISAWCRPARAEEGLFQGNVVVQGQRRDVNESVMIVAGAERYDVTAELSRCP